MDTKYEDEERKRADENAQFKREALKIARQQNLTKTVSTVVAAIGFIVAVFTFYAAWAPSTIKNELEKVTTHELKQLVEYEISKSVKTATVAAVEAELDKVKSQIAALSSVPDEAKFQATLSETRQSLSEVDKRLKSLEVAILETPEKAISIPLLRKEVESIRSSSTSEVTALRAEVARIYDLNKWFVGLMFTMALGIIGLAVSNFIKPIKGNES